MKTKHLQQLYEAALFDLKQTQSNGSLDNIELQLGGKVKTVNLKIPVMYIIGDNQGGDSICGWCIFYGKKPSIYHVCVMPDHNSYNAQK